MSGLDALRALRADPATTRIPVIAITASVMQHNRREIEAAGFDGFIEKPINVRGFLETVRAALERAPK
jgi:two-component system cell cycle response regulator DivK